MKSINKIICCVLMFVMVFSILIKNTAIAVTTNKSYEAFEKMSDDYIKNALKNYNIAGAAISVVKDGKIFFKKGYGYADLEKKVRVDPDKTDFQIASVSKLITTTAAMKLVDEGKLSLDEDVNKYLTDFKIKNNFSKPVTLRNLLTHTAGFDDKTPLYYKSNGDKFYDSIEPLGEFLKRDMPSVIREPGTYWQYSLHGMALVGYLIEKVSGMKVDKYITDNILNPLDMKNSSYWMTKDIMHNMSSPYKYQNGKYIRTSYTLCSDHPSGAVCATAADMAKFMLMHLNSGSYNGNRILKDETSKNMHKRNYSRDEKMLGVGLGFLENTIDGQRVIGHGGDLPSFRSQLTMDLEKNIGIFITLNTDSKDSEDIRNKITENIYRFFIGNKKDNMSSIINKNVAFDMDVNKINGRYGSDSYGQMDLTKIKSVLVNLKVKCDEKGNLSVRYESETANYHYVGNGLFYNEKDNEYCKITEYNGKMIFSPGFADFEKIPDINMYFLYASLIGLIVFVISIIVLLISIFKNRKVQEKQKLVLKVLMVALSLMIILYYVSNVMMAIKCITADTYIVINLIMPTIKIICYITLILTIGIFLYIVKFWKRNEITFKNKVFYCLLVLFAIINLLFMYVMNGFRILS